VPDPDPTQGTAAASAVDGTARRYRRGMVDAPMLPQHDRIVLVVLQDGRQLEGERIVLTDRFEVAGTVFEPWEIEESWDV
jgi:hypothetical protein